MSDNYNDAEMVAPLKLALLKEQDEEMDNKEMVAPFKLVLLALLKEQNDAEDDDEDGDDHDGPANYESLGEKEIFADDGDDEDSD